MASESSDERVVPVSVPSDLDEWLDAKAAELGVDEETVVVQLLASYRTADELDDGAAASLVGDDVETQVRDVVAERLPDIADAVSDRIETGDPTAVEDRLAAEIDGVESDFAEKLQDVRERVVQVKRETDDKAAADHTHPEFDEVEGLAAELDALEDRVDGVESALADREDDRADLASRVDELSAAVDRLDDVEERLRTVAWVVSDLKDDVETHVGASSAVERLKRSAAEADVDRAVCESCGQAVDIALLSEPRCPHCDATVSDVELPNGLFGKPHLRVAQQLESGVEDDDSAVPDAARQGEGP